MPMFNETIVVALHAHDQRDADHLVQLLMDRMESVAPGSVCVTWHVKPEAETVDGHRFKALR